MRTFDLPERPWNGLTVLDAHCCAGGMAMGCHLAGFRVVGVDIEPQPDYPSPFVQGDAVAYVAEHGAGFDLLHGSPPCQFNCALTVGTNASRGWGGEHTDLVAGTRAAMLSTGRPYVIEQPNGRAEIRKSLSAVRCSVWV